MAEPRAFGYARIVAAPLWALVAIATAELLVAHLLIRLWSPFVAAIVSLLSGVAVGWIAVGAAMLRRRPVLLCDDRLIWRLGTMKRLDVPRSAVAGIATADRSRVTFNCAALSAPNIVVALREPIRARGRAITALAHHLDDPTAFAAALAAWRTDEGGCPTTPDYASGAA